MTSPKPEKPSRPSPDFPLFAHARGKWAKKIDGKIYYFGRWEDPQGALEEYLDLVGRQAPTIASTSLSVVDACNLFLTAKKQAKEQGTLAVRTYTDLVRSMRRFADSVGRDRAIEALGPIDFARYKNSYAETNNLVSVGNEVSRIKSLLNYLAKNKIVPLIETGPDFRKPSAKAARKYRRERGKLLFTAADIRELLNESGYRMKAMIYLGINCGFHNSDIEHLTLQAAKDAVDSGVVVLARSKTEVERECPLWTETAEALASWLEIRPTTNTDRCFVLPSGSPMSAVNNDVAKRFRSVRDLAGIRVGGFSWLRKTFATIASGSGDQVAVNAIMGHVDGSISAVYRQEIDRERLRKVVEVVREWVHV